MDLESQSLFPIIRILEFIENKFPGDEIVGFGIGVAEKDGQPDPDRPLSIRLTVREKKPKSKLKSREAIPSRLTVPLDTRRNRQRNSLKYSFPTDVVEDTPFVASGGVVFKSTQDGTRASVTTGCVVRWRTRQSTGSRVHFGVISVAHDFKGEFPLPPAGIFDVNVAFPNGLSIGGSRIIQTAPWNNPPDSNGPTVDACLIQVDTSSLLDTEVIREIDQRALPYFSIQQLFDGSFQKGIALARSDFFESSLLEFAFEGVEKRKEIAGIGEPKFLIRVKGGENDFRHGTSGTIFQLLDASSLSYIPAAMQLGSDLETFSISLGQSIQYVMRIIRNRLITRLAEDNQALESFDLVAVF